VVSLRPITDANREAVEALAVTPDQGRFVSGVRESILEAAEEPDAQALYWAIYAEETPVGFVMIADEVGSPDYIAHYLWKLLIDERYQRRGFGTATLDLIVEYFRNRASARCGRAPGRARAARSRSTSDTASNEPEISTATRACSGWRSPSTSAADEPTSLNSASAPLPGPVFGDDP
jgi:GNAT superfamily N-acetyltransferase